MKCKLFAHVMLNLAASNQQPRIQQLTRSAKKRSEGMYSQGELFSRSREWAYLHGGVHLHHQMCGSSSAHRRRHLRYVSPRCWNARKGLVHAVPRHIFTLQIITVWISWDEGG